MRETSKPDPKRSPAAVVMGAVLAATILTLLGFGSARAGGIFLYEVGTPDMFTAGAGWAARAQDAATAFTNPAGMARLEGGDLLIGAGALYGDYRFTPGADNEVSGNDGGVAVGWFPGGGAYYVHDLGKQWWFGVAGNGNFGLSSGYDDGWVGRYYVESSMLVGISFVPAVAYRVNAKLSLGAGLNAMYGILENDVAVNNVDPGAADGELSLRTNDLSFGGNGGVLWELSDRVRLGAVYTSPVKLDFVDRPEFSGRAPGIEAALDAAGLLDSDLGLEITVPQTVMASFYWDVSADWALMGDVGWQDWSAFGGVNVAVAGDPPTDLSTQLPYKDTWRGALGAKRRLGSAWLLSAGVGYDSPMVEDEDRSVTLPAGMEWRFAAGAQRQMSERFGLGFGYTLEWLGSLPVDEERGPLAGHVAGSYDNTMIHLLSLQGHWRF